MNKLINEIISVKSKKKMSYQELERRSNINQFKIKRILNAKQSPTMDDLKELCKALDISKQFDITSISNKILLLKTRQIKIIELIIDELIH